VIAGGLGNLIGNSSAQSLVAGGSNNRISSNSWGSSIGGGSENSIGDLSSGSTIAGGGLNSIGTNSFGAVIGGGSENKVASESSHALVAGGFRNDIGTNSFDAVIGGGYENKIADLSTHSTIVGGRENAIGSNSRSSAIAGGYLNTIQDNSIDSVISGGDQNSIGVNSRQSAIGGGTENQVLDNSLYATIPGGYRNVAALYSFAAGANAWATNRGSFVWSDDSSTGTGSSADRSVTFRASGGYRFFTGTGSAGAQLLPGATAWSVLSDRNVKKDIQPLDCQQVLDKLGQVRLFEWRYLWQEASTPPNLGPMAQDFKAAFYPGSDDKTISTIEFDGVALAAIQGLNQKLEQQLAAREKEIANLKARLEKLERLISKQPMVGE
jgi:hypothetical protein